MERRCSASARRWVARRERWPSREGRRAGRYSDVEERISVLISRAACSISSRG